MVPVYEDNKSDVTPLSSTYFLMNKFCIGCNNHIDNMVVTAYTC